MIWSIIFWLAVLYIAVVIIWRLILAVLMVVEGYHDSGLGGAIGAAAINLVINIWDIAKFAFLILILAFFLRTCSKDKIGISETADIERYTTKIRIIINEATKYNDAYIALGQKNQESSSVEAWVETWNKNLKEYRLLYQQGEYIISEGKGFSATYYSAKQSVEKEVERYKGNNQEGKLMLKLLLEQLDTGNISVQKIVTFAELRNEIFDNILTIGPVDMKNRKIVAQRLQSALKNSVEEEIAAWQILAEIVETHKKFENLNKERLEIFKKLKK